MAILKVEQAAPAQTSVAKESVNSTFNAEFTGAPIELFQNFGIDPSIASAQDISAVNDISSWMSQFGSFGDGLMQLKSLQRSLGSTIPGERHLDKVYRWVSLQNSINELRKRQGALYG